MSGQRDFERRYNSLHVLNIKMYRLLLYANIGRPHADLYGSESYYSTPYRWNSWVASLKCRVVNDRKNIGTPTAINWYLVSRWLRRKCPRVVSLKKKKKTSEINIYYPEWKACKFKCISSFSCIYYFQTTQCRFWHGFKHKTKFLM